MSRDLHPAWLSEPGAEPVAVRVRETAAQQTAPARVTVSRRPAAAAGILVVMGLLASVYGTQDLFPGQLSAPSSTTTDAALSIRITETGFDPKTLSVRPGDTVTWINNAAIPYILTSADIETVDGPLDTSPIFPESSLAVTIAKGAKTGKFTYISQTSTDTGELMIDAAAAPASAPSPATNAVVSSAAPAPVSSVTAPPVAAVSSAPRVSPSSQPRPSPQPMPARSEAAKAPPQNIPVIPTTAVGAIPRNPYAINKPSYVDPVQPTSSKASVASSSKGHGGAPSKPVASVTDHKPTSQPGSGPENWIVAIVSVLSLCALGMQAMRKQAWTYNE